MNSISNLLNRWLGRIHLYQFLVVIVSLSLIRNGFALYGESIRKPKQVDGCLKEYTFPNSDPLRHLLSGLNSCFGGKLFIAFYTCLAVSIALLLLWEVRNLALSCGRHLLIYLSLLPGVTIVLGRFGTSDLLMISSSILAALTKSSFRRFAYIGIMSMSHTEAVFIMGIFFLLIGLADESLARKLFGNRFSTSVTLLLTSSTLFLPSILFGNGRIESFNNLLLVSLGQFLASGYWLVFSWFGGSIFYFISFCESLNRKDFFFFLFITLCLGSLSIVTADGTRVASMTLTFLLVRIYLVNSVANTKNHLFLGLITPAIYISNLNVFLPFRQMLYVLGLEPSLTQVEFPVD